MAKKNKSFGNYTNGIPKRLCTNCPYRKVSFGKDSWCKLYNKNNGVLGIYEWYDFPHPKCPLATMTYNKLLKLAHYYKHQDGWAYYEAKKLGLAIPGLSDSQNQKTTKEVKDMNKVQETIQYYTDKLDELFKEESFEELSDFLGTGICDGYCDIHNTGNCPQSCALFYSVHKLIAEPTNENLNEVKSFVCQAIHKKLGG